MRRSLVLILAMALPTVMAAGTAAAQGPDIEGSESWFTETIDDIGFCAFPVELHSTVHEVITPSGVQHWHGFESYTNPANGTSFASTWSESWKFGNKGIQGNGVLWKLTVPGYGVVLLEGGFVLYGGPPDYQFIRGAGPSIDGAAIEAFCDLLA